jgi:hypothetical protein
MDPITLIITAIATGASAGSLEALKDDVKDAAKRAYAKLRRRAQQLLAGRPDGELVLERYESAPQRWEPVLAGELTDAGAASDTDLIGAARELMELVDGDGARAGKFNVTIKDSKGVQVGDGNIQVNRF